MKTYKALWVCGPNVSGYPGGFPNGLMNRVKKHWWGKKRLYMCSGGVTDSLADRVDVRPEVKPTMCCDARSVPRPDMSYDWIMIDPPYSLREAKDMYGNKSCPTPHELVREAIRLCKPGGHVLLLHRKTITLSGNSSGKVKNSVHLGVKVVGLVGIVKEGINGDIVALMVWRKHNSLVHNENITEHHMF